MSRPALIPHNQKALFHNKKSCIDIRDGQVHSIKANTNNRTWFNEVNADSATYPSTHGQRAIIVWCTRLQNLFMS